VSQELDARRRALLPGILARADKFSSHGHNAVRS
jgi:hypothetical protein